MSVTIEDVEGQQDYLNLIEGKSNGEKSKITFDLMVECLVKGYVNSPNLSLPHQLASIVGSHSLAYRSIEKHVHGISPNNPLEGICMHPWCVEDVYVFRSCTKCCYKHYELPTLPEGHYYNCRAIAANCTDAYHVAAKKVMLCQKHDTIFDDFYPNLIMARDEEMGEEEEEENSDEKIEKLEYNANLADKVSDYKEYLKNKEN